MSAAPPSANRNALVPTPPKASISMQESDEIREKGESDLETQRKIGVAGTGMGKDRWARRSLSWREILFLCGTDKR